VIELERLHRDVADVVVVVTTTTRIRRVGTASHCHAA
jgi:hypothetical protein